MNQAPKRTISFVSSLVFIALLVSAFFFRQDIYDWWRLRSYDPPKDIAALAETTTMNDDATDLFYVAHPQVVDGTEFNEKCHIAEFSIILGCYVASGFAYDIYIYNVSDKRLDGIQEVTAAHEMLHAAYDRLSDEERQNVDDLLVSEYKSLDNKRIKETVKQYQDNDPSSVPNELHSILGTEVRSLSPALENYYKNYFDNRSKVVALSEKYESVFESREQRVAQLDHQLSTLKTEIESDQQRLSELNTQLSTKRNQLDQLRSSGQTGAYNAQVGSYNSMVNEYNSLVETTKDKISEYNSLVKQRNALVVEVRDLVEAIDSTPERIE